MKGYTPAIQRAVEALASAQAELTRAVARQQQRCQHLDLIECGYMQLYSGVLEPKRLCCTCGMTEDGWGYVVLEGRAVRVDRDEVYRRRLGIHIASDAKGPLLRGEVTVAQLVDRASGAPAPAREVQGSKP